PAREPPAHARHASARESGACSRRYGRRAPGVHRLHDRLGPRRCRRAVDGRSDARSRCAEMTARHDVVFVSMPFGPLFSPSLALSLLQPHVQARGLSCSIEYFTLAYAERIGQALYSKILTEHRAMARGFVGEWI